MENGPKGAVATSTFVNDVRKRENGSPLAKKGIWIRWPDDRRRGSGLTGGISTNDLDGQRL